MLAFIATLLSTWTLFSLIGYVLSDMSLRDCYIHPETITCMTIFGWIPSVIVGCDLDKKLNNY